MPPKAKGKKGKKAEDDDAYWESKAAALDIKSPPPVDEEEDVPIQSGKKVGNPFDMLEDGDDDDGGGLLGTIQASKKRDKKSKKKRTDLDGGDLDTDPTPASAPAHVDTNVNPDDEWPEEEVKPKKSKKGTKADDEPMELDEAPAASPALELAPVPVQTAVNVDDEWPEDDVKLKKGKKGKKGKKTVDGDEDDWMNGTKEEKKVDVVAAAVDETPAPAPVQEVETAAVEAEVDGEPEDDGPKILTKAQKEKLKKEKEKAKKKAQAAGKTQPAATPEPAAEATPVPVLEAEDESEEEGGAGDDKKKKRKKKPAAKPVEPVSVAKGAKKVSAQILALQAAMEEKKRIEEQARRAEEERSRALAEEEERIAAEEKRIEDQKLAKRAKEKEKRAQAKAEGRLLTPAQKKEKAAAEARKQAMLASGMKVAGLHAEGPERKKPGFAKKKPVQAVKEAEPTLEEATISPATPAVEEEAPASSPEPVANGGDDDWDKSEDEAAAVEGIVAGMDKMRVEGDDWDKSDDESATPPTAPSASTGAAAQTTAIPPVSATPKSTSIPNGKPAVPKTKGSAAPAEADASSEEETSSEEDSDDTDESSEDEMEARKSRAIAKIQERQKAAEAAKSKEDLRSPICCILGHVDTGKTKLLDKIRQTSVQEGEAGGITQQIGATFFPKGAIEEKTAVVNKTGEYQVEIPGLLIIDTPGHESFTNLRTRGSSLCNIAILVVDITHGLEPQTIESLNLLRNGKTPFIVALNKIDRMYGWKPTPNGGFRETLAQQAKTVRSEFEDRVKKTKLAFAEQGLNAEIFDENTNLARTVSLVPTSAITGEGIPDMLMLLVKLTQERMNQSLMYISELECTILEVKVIEGLGTTIDVILSNGVMRESDKIVLCGMDGPIVTTVRALLTPQPLRELRVKSAYVHHKEVKAALGIKISAPGLEKAIAGARLYVAQDDDEVEAYKDLAMQDVNDLQRFASKGPGVWVQASTLGSLEALLTFLQQMKIPVRNFAIGPVFRSHVLRAGRMLEVASEYALILAFDVPIDKDAKEYADKEGVKIFSAMIIYHLFDAFKKYMGEVQEAKRQAAMPNAVWPVRLSIIKAFANRDPIVLGVDIVEGTLRTGMPVGVVRNDKETGKRDIIVLGKITSIEINHKSMEIVKKSQIGAGAAVKIERAPYQAAKLYGRHFDDKDEVVSLITRQSIDTLKNSFRDQVDLADWGIIKKMKVEQGIP